MASRGDEIVVADSVMMEVSLEGANGSWAMVFGGGRRLRGDQIIPVEIGIAVADQMSHPIDDNIPSLGVSAEFKVGVDMTI